MFKGSKIPAIPMIVLLRQFAKEKDMPFDMRWENIQRLFIIYSNINSQLN